MATVLVTGSGGLIGSESVAHFVQAGYDVIGLENDMRARFFGPSASTAHTTERPEHSDNADGDHEHAEKGKADHQRQAGRGGRGHAGTEHTERFTSARRGPIDPVTL